MSKSVFSDLVSLGSMLRWLLLCFAALGENCPENSGLMQLPGNKRTGGLAHPHKSFTADKPPCPTGGAHLNVSAVVVAPCLAEGTLPLKAPIISFDDVIQNAKADADPYKAFCGDLEDSVCKMAYGVIDHGMNLASGRWESVATNYGSNGWGSSDMDICQVQTDYVTAMVPSCNTLEKIGGCSDCQLCCQNGGEDSSCYKALRPMLDSLMEVYTHSVKYYLAVSVRTVNLLKYLQRVALDYSVEATYDKVMFARTQMKNPPPAQPSFSAAMAKIFLETLVSFTHSASASFNFFKGAYKGKGLDYLSALIRLIEKAVVPVMKENSEFKGDLGGWVAQPTSPLFETQKEVTFGKDQIIAYYFVVIDNLVATMKRRIARVVSSSWARTNMADQHVNLEDVLSTTYQDVLGPIMGKDGFCIPESDAGGVKSDTFVFEIMDATVRRYQTFQALMPVSYRICAENARMCKNAPMERINHEHGSGGGATTYEADYYNCQTGCNPAACFLPRAEASGPILFKGDGGALIETKVTSPRTSALLEMEKRATRRRETEETVSDTALDHSVGDKGPCWGGHSRCSGGPAGQRCWPNHETCDSYCANDDAQPGPTDNCNLMRGWTGLSSVEQYGASYSAWLCGWESDDDMSKIWMPNADLMATIDRLVQIFSSNKTQKLAEVLKPNIQGVTRWKSTLSTGWGFHIERLPKCSFINSDDGKMMIYDQQIGQNCNWYSDSSGCAGYNEFKSGEYAGRCGNEPFTNEQCGCVAEAPLIPVRSCEVYTSPTNYCKDWCNVGGKWGCGIASYEHVTCDCSGCNGCPVCETVMVGPNVAGNVAMANLTHASFSCPSTVDKSNWLTGDTFDDKFDVTKDNNQVVVERVGHEKTWYINLAFQCCDRLLRQVW